MLTVKGKWDLDILEVFNTLMYDNVNCDHIKQLTL
jgi:hypothetical protein